MTPELNAMLNQWNKLNLNERYFFTKTIQIQDGGLIQFGTSTGTKLGTAASQKLAFFGITPVVQQSAPGAANTQGGTYNQTDVQSIATAVNSLRASLIALGLIA